MSTDLAVLPPNVASRGVSLAQWNTLCDSLFPGAKTDSVLMVLDYCKARGLDPMKKPCHIVPMWSKAANAMRDVVMPGIYEYRMTAHDTGLYLGHSEPEYGPDIEFGGVTAPEWCAMTMFRWHEASGREIPFPQKVWFREVVGLKDGKANDRWSRSPMQMLTKCCEAAGLREAFPGQLGGTHTEDEMYGKTIEVMAEVVQAQGDNKRRAKPATKAPESTSGPAETGSQESPPQAETPAKVVGGDRITASQCALLEQRMKRAEVPVVDFCTRFKISRIVELPFDSMTEASDWIAKYQPQEQK